MTMNRMELITSARRRRRWSMAQKVRLVAAALEPGAVASVVARRAGIQTSQLFRWRKELCDGAPRFSAVAFATEPIAARTLSAPSGLIEVELAGARMRISGAVDPATVAAVIGPLAAGRG